MIWKILLVLSLGDLVLSEKGAVSEQRVVMHHPKPEQKKYPTSDGDKQSEYHEDYAWSYPSYEFSYKVKDPETHDEKGQHEKREGDEVKGLYWLIEPDGNKRTVNYEANDNQGFNAQVDVTPEHGIGSGGGGGENQGGLKNKIVTHKYEVVEIIEEDEKSNAKEGENDNNEKQQENVTEQQNNTDSNTQGEGAEEEAQKVDEVNDENQNTEMEENTENNNQSQGENQNNNNEESQNNENDEANDVNDQKNNLSEISNDTKMKNEGKQKIRRENKGSNSNNSNHIRNRGQKNNKNSIKVNNALNGGNGVHQVNHKNNKIRQQGNIKNNNPNIPPKNNNQREVPRNNKNKGDSSNPNIKTSKKENKTTKNNYGPQITLVDIEANTEGRNTGLIKEKDLKSEHRIRIYHPKFVAAKY